MAPSENTRLFDAAVANQDADYGIPLTHTGTYMYLSALYISCMLLLYLIYRTFEAPLATIVGIGMILVGALVKVSICATDEDLVRGSFDTGVVDWLRDGG